MFYKEQKDAKDIDPNCLDDFAAKIQYEKILSLKNIKFQMENEQTRGNVEYLINTILKFEYSDDPDNSLLTIYDFLKGNNHFNLDDILKQCNAIQIMIDDLHSSDTDYVQHILITLYALSENSFFTLEKLCQNIGLFSGLLEHPGISHLLPYLSNLLFKVVKFDNQHFSATLQLSYDYNFIGKIHNMIDKHHYNDQQILTILINCTSCIFDKLSKEQLHVVVGGVKLIKIPLNTIHEYIKAESHSVLIAALQCFEIILKKGTGKWEDYLPDEIFEIIIKKLENIQRIDETGVILKEILNVINVIMPFLAKDGNIYDENETKAPRFRQLINALISQINKNKEFASCILNTIGRIAKYEATAQILIEKQFLTKLYSLYKDLHCKEKLDIIKVFLYLIEKHAHVVIYNCDNVDRIILDGFDNLTSDPSEAEIEFASSYFKALWSFFSEDNSKTKIFLDDSEVLQMISSYENYSECSDDCLQIRNFYSEDEKTSPDDLKFHDAFVEY